MPVTRKSLKLRVIFFTNINAIHGWGRADFRTVSHKESLVTGILVVVTEIWKSASKRV